MLLNKDTGGIENTYQGTGINEADLQAIRKQYGFNEIPEKHVGPVMGILQRMWGPIPWLLEAAMIFELILGKGVQAAVVFLLLIFSAVIGQIQENRAKKAIGYLHQQLQISARTLRNGKWLQLLSRELVPGDIVHVKVGDIVPADMEIINGTVSVDESALTGESIDVTKEVGETIFSASTINHGEVIARVSAIGTKSSYGKTAELVRIAEAPGRLQALLFTIVRYLAYVDVILAVILVVTAVIRGTPWQELLPFLVILFIATIPISMPSSFVVANSLEAKNLAKEHVLVTGLTGIQEAASMNVLLVDKTGTLTNNRPEIADLVPFEQLEEAELLKLAAAASDDTSNDSINKAILGALKAQNLVMPQRTSFTAFDPVHKVSKAQITQSGNLLNVVLGSPTVISEIAAVPDNYVDQVDFLSSKGSRVLAVASGENEQLVCQGLIALADSPREDAKESIASIKKLGIRIIMLTGDTVGTARAIAKQVGIGSRIGILEDALSNPLDFDGFANVYPEDKYRIVQVIQKLGMVVGMTGDGINDAPALKQADVGIAVSTATDVAKSAARVVLTEPKLSDITKVIDSGHRVYRRMMTWTITKLARTAELAALLTFGLIFAGFFPVSLSLIVFIVVMNDIVTLTLGTDNAWPTSVPENWNMPQLAKISAIFTIGWLALGLGLLWFYQMVQNLHPEQISSLMFLYLIYSAMATIFMTRTRDQFWSFAPSKWVAGMIAVNIVVATLMAAFGWVMAAVSLQSILILLVITLFAMLILDGLKVQYYRVTGILGLEKPSI
ncbi:divalent cation transporter [Ornatilinea apprima]|uniref:Divalent cation transporter n=1 Tax=Ornatilinea apprima TaxID=1134406 RepID=A0A0P6XLT4_9CHLR|nr:HAD-IC family P-type ATPase [Ornatilinea apprima]KPL77263.1 divalent cation transporter [Ornatilinea apprima]